MAHRVVSFAPNEYYHIYNRGNSKQKIFIDTQDYQRFVLLLYVCNQSVGFKSDNYSKGADLFLIERTSPLVGIGAYCLMHNHFHLLLTAVADDGISKFMQKVSTAYAMYYNKKYKRSGVLFEGKFKAEHASEDRYLKYLFSYIHLNPVKKIQPKWKEEGIRDELRALEYAYQYQYSSLQDMKVSRKQSKVLAPELFPPYFATKKDMSKELLSWITFNKVL